MQKECDICGDEFEAQYAQRKYCDRCRKNPAKSRAFYARSLRASKYRMGEMPSQQIKEGICIQCGKSFHSYSERSYCSDTCRKEFIIRHARCNMCSKPLFPLGIIAANGRGYCSDECRTAARWKRAREDDRVGACEHCGKEFIRASYSNIYCSKDCFKAHTHPSQRVVAPIPKVTTTCVICGNSFEKYRNTLQYTCSKACAAKRTVRLREQAKQSRHEDREAARKAEQNTRKHLVAAVLQGRASGSKAKSLHLCTGCKTSQKNCDYFSSKFKLYPENAEVRVVDGQNIVVTCPKYCK